MEGAALETLDGWFVAERGCRMYVVGAHQAPSGCWLQVAFDDAPGSNVVLRVFEGATADDAVNAISDATGAERWPHVIEVRARYYEG